MGLFSRLKEAAIPRVQLRSSDRHPFGQLDGYVPLGSGDLRLYRAIREAVPVIDAAIMKLIRLTGGFTIRCSDPHAESAIAEFLRNVNTGRGQRGINSFIDLYLDSLITCGCAIGEIVTRGSDDIAALICGNVADIHIVEGDSPLDFTICARKQSFRDPVPLPFQNLLLFTPFNPEPDNPYGVSLLRSMPFMADVFLKIFNTIGVNWERMGNVRFAVVYKPQGDIIDRAFAKERSEQIASEWSAAMQSGKNGSVRDFVAVGDVDIRVIGADNQILDSAVPIRQILEQIVSRTGIPPFLLGLNWSSTERMSVQQADLMTSELTAIRRSITPIIEHICDLWLRMHGFACSFFIDWDDINLQDCVEEAKAQLYIAQAESVLRNDDRKEDLELEDY